MNFRYLQSNNTKIHICPYLLKSIGHNLWSVVDSKNNVCNASCSKCLDLMQNHGLVAKLYEGLGESESLAGANSSSATFDWIAGTQRRDVALHASFNVHKPSSGASVERFTLHVDTCGGEGEGAVQEVSGEYRSHRRE